MRKNVYWTILVATTALIEATWMGHLRLQGVLPDLVLVLVVYFAISSGEERAMLTGLFGGIFQDVASDAALGHHVLCLVIVGYAVGRFSERLITDHAAVRTALVFCACLVHGMLYAAVEYVQNPDMGMLYTIGVSVIPRSFYTALATPLVFFFLARSKQFSYHAQGGAT